MNMHMFVWFPPSPSIGLTNLAKPYHVHYHLSQPDMAGPRLGRGATRRAPASVQRFALLADVRGNKACSSFHHDIMKSGIGLLKEIVIVFLSRVRQK